MIGSGKGGRRMQAGQPFTADSSEAAFGERPPGETFPARRLHAGIGELARPATRLWASVSEAQVVGWSERQPSFSLRAVNHGHEPVRASPLPGRAALSLVALQQLKFN